MPVHRGQDSCPSLAELKSNFVYIPETGQIWSNKTDKFVGHVHRMPTQQYVNVKVTKKKTVRGHRLAWALYYGKWPKWGIDHINGDTLDNRLCNLRDVPQRINMRNQTKRATNTSGYTGVSWHSKAQKYQARVRVDGKEHHLGMFEDADAAHEAVKAFREVNLFSKRHGTESKDASA